MVVLTSILEVIVIAVALGVVVWFLLARSGAGRAVGPAAEPVPRSDEGVRHLIARGETIAAVKLTRELYGLGLKDAKDRVDAIKAGASPIPPATDKVAGVWQVGPEAEQALRGLLASGQTIEAIKRYRELTGLGLAESKAAIERMAADR